MHPETPKEGVLLTEEFPDLDIKKMLESLNKLATPFGIKFNPFDKMPNTQLALIASEFARDNDKYDEFHSEIFRAIFTQGQDIGQIKTVLTCAEKVGLDNTALKAALQNKTYIERLKKAKELGEKYQVAGLPTFIINDHQKIVGVHTYEAFVKAVEMAKSYGEVEEDYNL